MESKERYEINYPGLKAKIVGEFPQRFVVLEFDWDKIKKDKEQSLAGFSGDEVMSIEIDRELRKDGVL